MNASWPVKSGHPCIGCSERDFWDRFTPFYERLSEVEGFGVEAQADKVGSALVGLAAAGVAAHGVYTWLVRKGTHPEGELIQSEELRKTLKKEERHKEGEK
jgi:Ni,Fe-hydrogenase I small subunit